MNLEELVDIESNTRRFLTADAETVPRKISNFKRWQLADSEEYITSDSLRSSKSILFLNTLKNLQV
jgi:hypothetical protein